MYYISIIGSLFCLSNILIAKIAAPFYFYPVSRTQTLKTHIYRVNYLSFESLGGNEINVKLFCHIRNPVLQQQHQ
jgi:hypothetical protein